ncbi:MAG: dTDP-4-dehydrorhamnose 3,5-epimerase family protein [Thermoplasmata archaeon]|nr:dTDP-4-dehydrorhamnose 3,5-epimerase family protein [Thermoplasmata archaeon]
MKSTSDAPSTPTPHPIRRILPPRIQIGGVRTLIRSLHQDPRGFLVETLRRDDQTVEGSNFVMSYSSVTIPGEYRDADRWHLHKVQTDRFVVPLGEMTLALLDGRDGSPTLDRLEVILMRGAAPSGAGCSPKRDLETYLVTIPPGVLHCIGNLSTEPFLLQNYPTEFYNPTDEGRLPFSARVVPTLGRPFDWKLVDRRPLP